MTPVKNQLTGTRSNLRTDHGDVLVMQNNVKKEIYISVNGHGAWFPLESVKQILSVLYPCEGKHVAK